MSSSRLFLSSSSDHQWWTHRYEAVEYKALRCIFKTLFLGTRLFNRPLFTNSQSLLPMATATATAMATGYSNCHLKNLGAFLIGAHDHVICFHAMHEHVQLHSSTGFLDFTQYLVCFVFYTCLSDFFSSFRKNSLNLIETWVYKKQILSYFHYHNCLCKGDAKEFSVNYSE